MLRKSIYAVFVRDQEFSTKDAEQDLLLVLISSAEGMSGIGASQTVHW